MRRDRRKHSRKPLGRRILRVTGYTLFTLFVLALVLFVGAAGLAAGVVSAMVKDEKVRSQEDFQKDLDSLSETSYAYFQNKNQNGNHVRIGSLRMDGNDRKPIKSVKDVSPYLVAAFISVEDRDFYKHKGIVPRSLVRASYQQVVQADVMTGGSTITQQLVKNVILKDFDKKLERKAKEIVLAVRLDSMYEKNDILVYYMNSIFFGKGANGRNMYGVQAAAKGLFNTDAKNLNLAQSAYIAGMVQRPNDFNPFSRDEKKLKKGLERMKLVLREMLENKKITQREYDEALKFDIKGSLAKPEDFSNSYESYPFIMYAVEEAAAEALMEKDGLKIEQLSKQGKYKVTLEEYKKKAMTGGYHFYTTINQKMYDAVNKAATNNLRFYSRTYEGKKGQEQLGAVILDNKTGAVLAFVSGTKDFEVNQKDHALDATNQPGSAIKPLLVYGPAIEEKVISPETIILDEEIPKSDGSGTYRNASGNYKGPVSATLALQHSYNIPAIKVFNHLGHQTGFNYLKKLGLPPHPYDGESAAIGGATNGYTVERMAAAFAALANEGKYNKPFIISKITDSDGNTVWVHKNKPTQVFSPQTAYQTTKMLRKVVSGGTGRFIGSRIYGYDLAGKTGTSSKDRDHWFVGYTPQVTISVWGGYDYNFSMKHNPNFTKRAWVNIFKAAEKASPSYFNKGYSFRNPGGLFSGVKCLECDRIEAYLRKKQEEEEKKKQAEEEKKRKEKDKEKPKPPDPPDGPLPPDPPRSGWPPIQPPPPREDH
ncbi:transglycosylase domain-containing protein [Paenactinomyces guangxiensis]|uniref:Penicillin-binding protein n=1 Tax=Paenactinomyces guangxiensis TaxID=1490290 RepID=A0A7W1WMV2_9BACL|nr:transglycosylase domain-containing protein [Paenactinomyces guangxiensis]MBA4492835.1 penicillin-binding protein [Paenactinomyces guangxiensis]MBH8590316.1 penicillin-binding protein [Paenactinomyces guangxiensis]